MSKDKHKYIRVGVDYFKVIEKVDRFGITRIELKKWSKDIIRLDHGADYLKSKSIKRYDDFVIVPGNVSYSPEINNCYNMYAPFPHEPKEGTWKWTEQLLRHIFGDQYAQGLIYMQTLYLHPKQPLPVLVLVSKIRETGKTTFMDWLNLLFGANVAMIEPDVIGTNFNGEYATANIIAIDETILEKSHAVEKIKSLATKKFITVNIKNVQHFKLPFYAKIIMASNNENKFVKIDSEEIRFWVRNIPVPEEKNFQLLDRMKEEIPAFLHYLTTMPAIDFTKSRMVLTADEIANESLETVKEETKSWLYHDMHARFTAHFDENVLLKTFYVIPIDINDSWYRHDAKINLKWIKTVLQDEFKVTQWEGKSNKDRKSYSHFVTGVSKYGRPYLIDREMFDSEIEEYDDEPDF